MFISCSIKNTVGGLDCEKGRGNKKMFPNFKEFKGKRSV